MIEAILLIVLNVRLENSHPFARVVAHRSLGMVWKTAKICTAALVAPEIMGSLYF
jgi:hypothetical protein